MKAMDRIVLRGMVFSGRHGVSDAERERPQRFTVDIELETNLTKAGGSDSLADTVDYRQVHAIAKEVIEGEPAKLIESLADRIARRVLALSRVRTVSVMIAKRPPRMRPIDAASVHIRRTRRGPRK